MWVCMGVDVFRDGECAWASGVEILYWHCFPKQKRKGFAGNEGCFFSVIGQVLYILYSNL